MSQNSSLTTARPAPAAGAPARPTDQGPEYRSIVDGELATTWSLEDYFGSLNTVMRLPPKVRRKVEKAAQNTPGGVQVLAVLDRVRIPSGLLVAAFLLGVVVLVIKPLVLGASGGGADLTPVYGSWEAGKGKYAGRMFEISEQSIGFKTSAESPDYTRHAIESVRGRQVADSTLYTVTYKQDNKTAEFTFWFYGGGSPLIRFKNQHEVIWRKAGAQPVTSARR